MAGRVDWHFRQKVTEAELDSSQDKMENADRNLAIDTGITGVITGLVVSENTVPDLTLDVTAGTGYSQLGERLRVPVQQDPDMSIDENGNPTSVTTGNERWVTLAVQFDRVLSDPRIDGNGATVFFERAESFKLRVIAGAEAPTGTATRPPAPSDSLILSEFLMTFGKTAIINADLDITRRNDFVFVAASGISVTAGAWTVLDSGSATVQDALDDVDAKILDLNAARELEQHLVPDAASTRNLGSSGKPFANLWADDAEVTNDIALGRHLDMTAGIGDIQGPVNVGTVGDPATNIRGQNHISTKGTLIGAYTMSAAKSVIKRHNIQGATPANVSSWVYDYQFARFSSFRDIWHEQSAGGNTNTFGLDIPDGVTLTDVLISWGQESANKTASATARIFKVSSAGVKTQIGSTKTLGTDDAYQDDDSVITGAAEVVDLSTYSYILEVTSATYSTIGATAVSGYKSGYDITQLAVAAAT